MNISTSFNNPWFLILVRGFCSAACAYVGSHDGFEKNVVGG